MSFYAEDEERESYQEMLNGIVETPEHDSSTSHLAGYVTEQRPNRILEVGCGNGRLFRALRRAGCEASYTGVEVAEHIVAQNQNRHPDASWYTAGAYDLPVGDASVDVAFAEFVLEHLVFPSRGLSEMLRVVRPGGHLVLVFPDFVCAGRLGSQILGLSPLRTVSEALQRGRLLDGLISIYDSRVRLPRALDSARANVGPFPVNVRPACLTYPDFMFPDVDAVYIASKCEVRDWAEAQGHEVTFPAGTTRPYDETAFLAIRKTESKR
jgi:SAM-dependent methyltransferase